MGQLILNLRLAEPGTLIKLFPAQIHIPTFVSRPKSEDGWGGSGTQALKDHVQVKELSINKGKKDGWMDGFGNLQSRTHPVLWKAGELPEQKLSKLPLLY